MDQGCGYFRSGKMRVYHFVNEIYGLDDIRNRQIKIARINELNDPFEFLCVESSRKEVRDAFLEVKRTLAGDTGILCFSQDWRNPVQWSHYADRHRGLCLGFDIADHLLGQENYVSYRIDPDWNTISRNREKLLELLQKVLVTKFSHWRYEREYRLFSRLEPKCENRDGLYFQNFSDEMRLSEVIVGAACTLSRQGLADALGNEMAHIKVKKARLAFKTFKVVEQREKSLWQ
jgi:Protein of unknown function (DUF2971)